MLKEQDTNLVSKVLLKEIKKEMLNIDSWVWITMTGFITDKNLVSGLYKFINGTKSDPMFQIFDTLDIIAEAFLVEYTEYQWKETKILRLLDEVLISSIYFACLNIEASNLETDTIFYSCRKKKLWTDIGKN